MSPADYLLISLVFSVLIICFFRFRRIYHILLLGKKGYVQFFTCDGREKWGTPVQAGRWRNASIIHLVNELTTIQNDAWLIRNKMKNATESGQQEQEKLSRLLDDLQHAGEVHDNESSGFIAFEISRSREKLKDLQIRVENHRKHLHALSAIQEKKKKCLDSYRSGNNPALPLSKRLSGFFFYLK